MQTTGAFACAARNSGQIGQDYFFNLIFTVCPCLPIELEHVPGEELLGSITSTQEGTITMQQPANETVLRLLRSAGSKSAALSGFSMKRHTRPIRLVRPQVEDLIEIYRRRGFDQRELLQLASRFRV